MTVRILITLVSLLFLSALANGQSQKSPPPPPRQTELASINSYAKSIDQFTKRNPKGKRLLGNAAGMDDKLDKWREFQSDSQMDEAGTGDNLFESAAVWLKDGKVVVAYFSFTSPSGDWYHFVDYYFRADGTLAKIHAQLNTFFGDISVVRERFYSSSGKLLRTSTRYLDLQSQKSRKRGDFQDEPIPLYLRVRELPFSNLL